MKNTQQSATIGLIIKADRQGVSIGEIDLDGINEQLRKSKYEVFTLRKQIVELKNKYDLPLTKEEENLEEDFETEIELSQEIKQMADEILDTIFKSMRNR